MILLQGHAPKGRLHRPIARRSPLSAPPVAIQVAGGKRSDGYA